uniref:NADH-ubiquinone oxidoreductase 15 kDa subunit n=1 Tax=Eptatretus burgeri TaxID=7764 RepID=A0A8C4QUT0_EPTBU
MPFFDPKELFGWNMDRHLLLQSTPQPLRYASKCCVYERDYVECADALTLTRAKKECLHEWEDLMECMHRKKTVTRRCVHFPPVLQGPPSGHPPGRCQAHPHLLEMMVNLLQP